MIGNPSPEFEVMSWLTEKPLKISDLKDKVVVLYFWNSDVYQTVEKYVVLSHWQKKYENDVVFIAVHDYIPEPGNVM